MSGVPEGLGRRGRQGAAVRIAEDIRRFVEERGLQPGERLGREEDLAHEFGVSKTTMREALRLLSSAHLVRASQGPGGGIFVANTAEGGIGRSVSEAIATMLDARSIGFEELVETRLLLEVPLAGIAAQHATDEQLVAMRAALADAADVDAAETRLRALIAEAAGNRLAAAFTAWITDVLQPRLRPLIADAVVDEVLVEQLASVVRGIERGDPGAAERAMREHLVYLGDVLAAVRRRDGFA